MKFSQQGRLVVLLFGLVLMIGLSIFATLCDETRLHILCKFQDLISPSAFVLHTQYGFLVLAAWLFGWRSVLMLAPVIVLVSFVLDQQLLLKIEVALLYVVLLISAPTVFSLFRLGTDHAIPFDRLKLHWRFLLAGGVLSAVLCTMLSAMVGDLMSRDGAQAATMLSAMAGKIIGLFAALALIWLVFRTMALLRRVI
ncbi:hypothetical protein [Pontivivens ytuae]|uniref:Uncharacterized protein n=1 Tax=Pontivivens ytuae TaxID=2789856 RepID=A0A7S9QD92_9RHOB|nr:hypothetical protein [Pontivivens ytuae]QPH54142.1 hypothetical protein I0K15_20615 [Pontivivens ytuae]